MFKKVDKCLSAFEDVVMIAGIFSAAIVLFINVVLRYFFRGGIVWAEEYARFAIIWITVGCCAAAVRADIHMKITAVLDILSAPLKKAVNTFVILSGILFGIFTLIYGWQQTVMLASTNQLSPAMEIPMYWIYAAFPIGGALLIIRYAQSMYRLYANSEGKDVSEGVDQW